MSDRPSRRGRGKPPIPFRDERNQPPPRPVGPRPLVADPAAFEAAACESARTVIARLSGTVQPRPSLVGHPWPGAAPQPTAVPQLGRWAAAQQGPPPTAQPKPSPAAQQGPLGTPQSHKPQPAARPPTGQQGMSAPADPSGSPNPTSTRGDARQASSETSMVVTRGAHRRENAAGESSRAGAVREGPGRGGAARGGAAGRTIPRHRGAPAAGEVLRTVAPYTESGRTQGRAHNPSNPVESVLVQEIARLEEAVEKLMLELQQLKATGHLTDPKHRGKNYDDVYRDTETRMKEAKDVMERLERELQERGVSTKCPPGRFNPLRWAKPGAGGSRRP